MTVSVNPLMGNLSTTYAVKAGSNLTLCSRFDFNVYSYESDLVLGCELWRHRRKSPLGEAVIVGLEGGPMVDTTKKSNAIASLGPAKDENVVGVLKARVDQNLKIGLLWEGRIKDLLFSLGSSVDLKHGDQPFRAIGLQLQYSS
jgi:mitochondrial distribution and morphology protein 10